MKRKAAESHDLVCPEATVECQFAEAGCEVKPKRKDLESHLDANMKQHLSQLMTAHVKMKLKLLKKAMQRMNQPRLSVFQECCRITPEKFMDITPYTSEEPCLFITWLLSYSDFHVQIYKEV